MLFFQGIQSRDLWASHEARAAQNAQRMLDDGDWLLPRLYDGQVEMQKPPGFYWMVAVVGWLRGGVDATAVRLPAALAGMLTVMLVWWHLRRRGRPVAGFVAAAVLAGAVHFTGTARIGRIDVPLACAVAAIMLVSRDALAERGTRPPRGRLATGSGEPGCVSAGSPRNDDGSSPWQGLPALTQPGSPLTEEPVPASDSATRSAGASRLTVVLVGVIAGTALLLKGPIGVVLPAAALAAFALIESVPVRRLLVPAFAIGGVALAIAAPWFIWANAATDGEFFRVFFVYHHFNRAFGGAETLAGHPWWFYLPRFAADFLPWTPLLLAGVAARRWRGDPDARFGLVWFVAMIGVLSVSRFKRADYLLPAYGGAAIFLGCVLERWYLTRTSGTQRRVAFGFALGLALLPVGWLVFDHFVTSNEEAAHAQAPFARHIRERAPTSEPVLLFRVESHLLAFHLGRPVHTLVEWADLLAAVREPGPHFVVTRAEFLDDVRQSLAIPFDVLLRSEDATGAKAYHPLVLLRFPGEPCPSNPPRD